MSTLEQFKKVVSPKVDEIMNLISQTKPEYRPELNMAEAFGAIRDKALEMNADERFEFLLLQIYLKPRY